MSNCWTIHEFTITIPFSEPLDDEEKEKLVYAFYRRLQEDLNSTQIEVIETTCKKSTKTVIDEDGNKKKKSYHKSISHFKFYIPWAQFIEDDELDKIEFVLKHRIDEVGFRNTIIKCESYVEEDCKMIEDKFDLKVAEDDE